MTSDKGVSSTACLLSCLAAAGCDDVDWPEPRYIDTVRVLGVRADPPTLRPGATTQLSVACVDGSKGNTTAPKCAVQVGWFAQCNNPPDNDPERCLARYSAWADDWNGPLAEIPATDHPEGFGFGPSFTFSAPPDVLVATADIGGRTVRYGTSYVFFVACAGKLEPSRGLSKRLPVECRHPDTNELLDQRSYVVGVTTLYTYDSFASSNPIVEDVSFDDIRVPKGCATHLDCPAAFECSASAECVPVVPTCPASSNHCEHCLRLDVASESFGLFDAEQARLDAPSKSLWLSAFTNAGQLPDDEDSFPIAAARDPESTIRTQCVRWRAPSAPTEHAHLWAVLRDGRGGFTLWDQRIVVR